MPRPGKPASDFFWEHGECHYIGARRQANVEKPETISLSPDAGGRIYWNDGVIADTELAARLADAARHDPQPELHLRADRNTRYQQITELMVQSAGLQKIGFIADPRKQ